MEEVYGTKKSQWELINHGISSSVYEETERLKVLGGWIVRTQLHNGKAQAMAVSLVFIPDPKHEWDLNE